MKTKEARLDLPFLCQSYDGLDSTEGDSNNKKIHHTDMFVRHVTSQEICG